MLAWHGIGGGLELKNRVRQLREEQGLTQKQLGEKVNVSRQAINAVETGKFDPSLWLAYDIAQLFNKSIEEVFDFKESERKWNGWKTLWQMRYMLP